MNVVIVGAGIAGLSAGIGLRRAGHHVLILEQSSMSNEAGAAIHIPPNASRILLRWGFDTDRAMVDVARLAKTVDAMTLQAASYQKNLAYIEKKYGAPWLLCHRADLHSELKILATQKAGEGTPVNLWTNACVMDIDPDAGTVTLQNASTITADLIVAADGVHSFAASLVTGQPTPAIPTNTSAFRFLIPSEDILEDEETRSLLQDPGEMRIFIGDAGKRLVWYPCRRGQVQNFVGIHPDSDSVRASEEWNVKTSLSDFFSEFGNFHPQLLKACSKAKDIKLWKLVSRNPLPSWRRSRLLLVGDAAHPMLPHQGQGGAQAIEDGAALGSIFSRFPPFPSIELICARLSLFEDVRKNRASAMQIYSLAGQDEASKIGDLAKEYVKDGVIPTNPQEFYDWNFGYDIFSHCEKAIAQSHL